MAERPGAPDRRAGKAGLTEKRYVLSVPHGAKTYHYFRPGTLTVRDAFPPIRLSDDAAVAVAQAAVLMQIAEDPAAAALYRRVGPLLKAARRRAKDLGLKFALNDADVFALLYRQGDRCAISGIPFAPDRAAAGPFAPVLELIDDETSYAIDNVWVVCGVVSTVARSWGLDALRQVARAMVRKHQAPAPGRQPG